MWDSAMRCPGQGMALPHGRNMAHGTLRERADGEARINAQVGGDHGAIDDIGIAVAEQAVVRIHDAVGGIDADGAAAEDVRGAGNVE